MSMESAGDYETHLTVNLDDPERLEAFRKWCDQRGLKCVHIVLDRGARVSQPMLTRHGRGTLSGELAAASALGRELADAGFPVIRTKIEAAVSNRDVPASRDEAPDPGAGPYFEHHVKLLLGPGADRLAILAVAERH